MAYLAFRISYVGDALPAWEASRALRGITHLYYCGLIAKNQRYAITLNEIFDKNGRVFPEDLTRQLNITREDLLTLDVWNLSPSLNGKVSSENTEAAKNASDAIQILKDLKDRLSSKTDREKREIIENSNEIRDKLLQPIQVSSIRDDIKPNIERLAILSCLSLSADTIESIEISFHN